MTELGFWALALTAIVALYAALALTLGIRRGSPDLVASGRNGLWATGGLITLASFCLFALLLRRDFSAAYVFQHVSTTLPTLYTLSAFWAGQEGSLLLWLWLVVLLTLVFVRQRRSWEEPLWARALAVMALVQAGFALLLITASDPFARLPTVPIEGRGLNPLLQNPAMIYHPPTLFLGYAGYTVPFALTTASLLTSGAGGRWLRGMRPWSLLAWLALGMGILMGAQWSYVELGWGGYWAWDPVENGSLIPWLTGTALLHASLMREQRWAMLLAVLCFVLCLFATFVTRGGIILSELHGFAQQALPITYWLLGLMSLALAGPLWLLSRRWRELRSRTQALEGWPFFALWLMCGMAGVVLLGTIFPTLTRLFLGRQISLNRSFYDRTFGPLAAALVATMGACTLLRRGRGVIRQLRRGRLPGRRRLGATLVHLSLLFMALGVVGEGFFKTERWAVLRPGERVEVGSYTLTYEGTNAQITPAKHRLQATLRVERNGRAWAVLRPEKNFHWNAEQWVTEVAVDRRGAAAGGDAHGSVAGARKRDQTMAMIEVRGLTKNFGPQAALRGIDLDVKRGEFLTVVGANGAGKTTLMRILATLIRPTEGRVVVGGYDLAQQPAAARRLIGFVSHQPLLYDDLTAEENLRFYARLYGVPEAKAQISVTLSWVGLTARRGDLVRTFSRGMKQRLAIVRALLHDPPLLLLDEPYTGLDQEAAMMLRKVLAVLRCQGRTAVITTHNLEQGAALADPVAMLVEGRIVVTPSGPETTIPRDKETKRLPDQEMRGQ